MSASSGLCSANSVSDESSAVSPLSLSPGNSVVNSILPKRSHFASDWPWTKKNPTPEQLDGIKSEMIQSRVKEALSKLNDKDWEKAEKATGVKLVGDLERQADVKRYVMVKAKHAMETSKRALLRKRDFDLSSVAVGLFIIANFYAIYWLMQPPSDEEAYRRYYHPDMDPEMRAGETTHLRDQRVQRAREAAVNSMHADHWTTMNGPHFNPSSIHHV